MKTRLIYSIKSMCPTGMATLDHLDRAQQFILASGLADLDMKPHLFFLTGLSKSLMELPRDPVLELASKEYML